LDFLGFPWILSSCTWENGEVVSTFRQPFDMLAETVTAAAHVGEGDGAESAKTEIWLPFLNIYWLSNFSVTRSSSSQRVIDCRVYGTISIFREW
jgi:hypothetical protein